MMLLDTSVVIPIVRSKGLEAYQRLLGSLNGEEFALPRMTEIELLQGARDEVEWQRIQTFLDAQDIFDLKDEGWRSAARINFDLRRIGKTISGALDCCIAQIALQHEMTLFHNDSDFEMVATVRPLKLQRIV